MRNILLIGAGRSATSLIKYLLDKADNEDLFITIGDLSLENAKKFCDGHSRAKAILLDIFDEDQRQKAVQSADLVISMLPARFHIEVAKDCIRFDKHLVTASYVSDEMQTLDEEAKKKGLVFMNEIGLDPTDDIIILTARMRVQRDRLLAESDWTQTVDDPTGKAAEWAAYRQQLRDFPSTWTPGPTADFPEPPA